MTDPVWAEYHQTAYQRLHNWTSMEQMLDSARGYDRDRRLQMEHDIRRLCQSERRQVRHEQRARSRRVWVTDDGLLSCELTHRKPYCYTVTVTNAETGDAWFAYSFVAPARALFEVEVLRRVFAGVFVQ